MRKEHWDFLRDLQQSGSINASSLKYNISAQAMGKAIRTLENELEFQVITRSHTGVTLTPQGEKALEAATQFFDTLHVIQDEVALSPNATQNLIKLYVTQQFFYSYPLQLQYRTLFPKQELSLISKSIEDVIELLHEHKIDYAICTLSFLQNQLSYSSNTIMESFEFYPFNSQKIYAYVATSHPLAKYKSISLSSLFKYPFVAFSPDKSNEHSLLSALSSVGIVPPKNCTIESNHTYYETLLMQGKYVGLCEYDKKMLSDYFRSHICVIPVRDNLELRTGYLLRKEDDIRQYPLVIQHLESINAL